MVHTKQQQQQHKREKDLYTTQDTTYTQVLILLRGVWRGHVPCSGRWVL